ncbi:DEKNAAC103381 [Brettanomyces naardenensis]|uniref:DEKNAAC103382 n=1 Tax=Brettanomyces naardenensis TaxID=13370 RepID=A0A448YP52_BRENA|nr:DEKNAAC103381 [Brettanomyces naardenensis]
MAASPRRTSPRKVRISEDDDEEEGEEGEGEVGDEVHDANSASSFSSSDSSSDDDVDFVQLTKVKRARAMKAAKKVRYGKKGRVDDKEVKADDKPTRSTTIPSVAIPGEEIELDDSIVDAVISAEEKRMPELFENSSGGAALVTSSSDEREFPFEFQSVATPKDEPSGLNDEDLGELVESLSPLPPQKSALKVSGEPMTLDVPKFDENEINSDADYDFDPNELIRTLQNDDDELELLGNSDEDYSNFLLRATSGGIAASDRIDNYLTKQETEVMVNDLDGFGRSKVSDLGSDAIKVEELADKEEEEEESEGEGQDEDSDDDVEDSLDLLGFREIFDGDKLESGGLYVPQSAVFSEDEDGDDEEIDGDLENSREEGQDDDLSDYSDGSDNETNLLHYFFSSSSSESEGEEGRQMVGDTIASDSEETDEDTTIPRKSTHKIGSKRAKEVLSSSKNNFRAPKLGTFIVSQNRKPFGIIDGYSTRFLHPKGNKLSILKGTRAPVDITKGLSKEQRLVLQHQQLQQQRIQRQAQRPNSKSAVALDELLNISEFEDDEAINDASKFEWDSFFSQKRVPLNAFRNRGLVNNGSSNNYADATREYTFQSDTPMVRRPHHHHHHHHHHHKPGKPIPIALKLGHKNSKEKVIKSSKKTGFRKELNFGDEFVMSPSEPLKLRKGSKKRMRRKSIVEAQAEGFRATKSGLFNEEVLNDIEALLMDVGATEDYNFLFSNEG